MNNHFFGNPSIKSSFKSSQIHYFKRTTKLIRFTWRCHSSGYWTWFFNGFGFFFSLLDEKFIYFVRLGRIENQMNINSLGKKIDPSVILINASMWLKMCCVWIVEKELEFFSTLYLHLWVIQCVYVRFIYTKTAASWLCYVDWQI